MGRLNERRILISIGDNQASEGELLMLLLLLLLLLLFRFGPSGRVDAAPDIGQRLMMFMVEGKERR